MPRKRRLDPYVSSFVDRHGRERFRLRKGGITRYLPSPGAQDYRAAYDAALDDVKAATSGRTIGSGRARPRSITDLMGRFYQTLAFRRASEEWQATVRAVLEPFREEFGKDLAADFRPIDIEVILMGRMEKRERAGRMVGGPAAAERLREQLSRLFDLAIKLEWIDRNPVALADPLPRRKSTGYHSWTEEDISAFRARWPLGTKPRLAMELMLWTGLRRVNACRVGPANRKTGRIVVAAAKGGKIVDIPIAPALADAIDAMPAIGLTTWIVTEYGQPFSVAGFGSWFKDRCADAGLPHCTSHGLRKALARRAADLGISQQGLKALGKWSGDAEVATYVAAADEKRQAETALRTVIDAERTGKIG